MTTDSPTAKLSSTVNVSWTHDLKGYARDCDVEVDYTFDGKDDLRITASRLLGDTNGIGDYEFDELLWEAVMEVAPEAYAEWFEERYGVEVAA